MAAGSVPHAVPCIFNAAASYTATGVMGILCPFHGIDLSQVYYIQFEVVQYRRNSFLLRLFHFDLNEIDLVPQACRVFPKFYPHPVDRVFMKNIADDSVRQCFD